MSGRLLRAGRVTALVAAAAAAVTLLAGCGDGSRSQQDTSSSPRSAAPPRPGELLRLTAAAETEPVPHGGDAADDPAIWVNPADPARSTVIGTDKDGGLAVYDLSGRELQYIAGGRLNNVDVRDGFPLSGRRVALAAASDRDDDTIAVYRVDPRTRRLVNAVARPIHAGISVYGLCMYRSRRTATIYVFADSKKGEVEQWELISQGPGVAAQRVRTFDVGGTVEGCVADDRLGHLYLSEEDVGIWRYRAEPDAGTERAAVDSTGKEGHLTADVEGLAIAYGPGRMGFLIASSQGSDSFTVYRRAGNAYVGTFTVGDGAQVDGVEGTDGIDVTTTGLGSGFPHGLFVAQDGSNDVGNQNFKLVRWSVPRGW
jgi:3-phytase